MLAAQRHQSELHPTLLPAETGRIGSGADEPADDPSRARRAPGLGLHAVGPAHRLQACVRAEPAQRLYLPGRRVVAHPRQPGQLAVCPGDQVGQGEEIAKRPGQYGCAARDSNPEPAD